MWKYVENSDSTKPSEVEENTSKTYVYIRKDFVEIPESEGEQGQTVPAHWGYYEQKVKKEDWNLYKDIIDVQSDITDIELALVELYERGE